MVSIYTKGRYASKNSERTIICVARVPHLLIRQCSGADLCCPAGKSGYAVAFASVLFKTILALSRSIISCISVRSFFRLQNVHCTRARSFVLARMREAFIFYVSAILICVYVTQVLEFMRHGCAQYSTVPPLASERTLGSRSALFINAFLRRAVYTYAQYVMRMCGEK